MDTTLQSDKAQLDYQLVLAARDHGDQRAYADLLARYRMPVYTMLLRMTKNPTEADDLTIEAFSKAFRQLHAYVPTSPFASWLFAIASNHGIDFIRRGRVNSIPLSAMETQADGEVREYAVPSHDENPEEKLITHQRDGLLRQVVDKLPPRYCQIVKLRYFDELSYDDIATQLHLPVGTVKTQLNRSRSLLAKIINDNHSACL